MLKSTLVRCVALYAKESHVRRGWMRANWSGWDVMSLTEIGLLGKD